MKKELKILRLEIVVKLVLKTSTPVFFGCKYKQFKEILQKVADLLKFNKTDSDVNFKRSFPLEKLTPDLNEDCRLKPYEKFA